MVIIVPATAFTCHFARKHRARTSTNLSSRQKSWSEIEGAIFGRQETEPVFPLSIDSVLDPTTPNFSTYHPTLFRERHGWCPYSERIWLIMELAQMDYDTVRIDNTGGPRPSYYAGQTPQMRWPDGRTQGESMDLLEEIDEHYANGKFRSGSSDVQAIVAKFSSVFPRARPSSRAAFLFQMNGEPLWERTFEETLRKTDELLSDDPNGPFFCGSNLTAADIAWAPFLERYRYQLPCLHDGLDPADGTVYPNLAKWYLSMDKIPEYACRVKGDASSWRKVLTLAGFGNSGVPPQIQSNMDNLLLKEETAARECIDVDLWQAYAKERPYVQSSPRKEAAAIMTRNRDAIVQDIVKQSSTSAWKSTHLPDTMEDADTTLRAMIQTLWSEEEEDPTPPDDSTAAVQCLATFLDHRMCVPRDMGPMAAATIKNLAVRLRKATAV